MRLLLIEDHLQLGRSMRVSLQEQGHDVEWLHGAPLGSDVRLSEVDVAVVDIGDPQFSRLQEWCRVKQRGYTTKGLAIAKSEHVKLVMSQLGVYFDDFILKPFSWDEIYTRLSVMSLRSWMPASPKPSDDSIRVDWEQRVVVIRGRQVPATERELTLMSALLVHRGSVVTKAQLRAAMVGDEVMDSNAVEVHIHHLRRKIGHDFIKTIHGQGYVVDLLSDGDKTNR